MSHLHLVFDTGVPTYTFDYKVESSGPQFTLEGTIKQSGVPDGFAMPVPLFADGQYVGSVQVSDSEGEFRFRVAKKPERVVIDPETFAVDQAATDKLRAASS